MFEFEIVRTMVCSRCGEIRSSTQPDKSLIVNFDNGAPVHLQDLLRDETFGTSICPGRKCGKCSHVEDAADICRMATAPEILTIQIARFDDEDQKKTAVIPFDQDLDLSPYTSNGTSLKYRLFSVVQHRGTVQRGRYKTFAATPSGAWEEMNDNIVLASSVETAINNPEKEAGTRWTPYLLFWARVDDSDLPDPSTFCQRGLPETDDKVEPLQISINGVIQPSSTRYFIRKSAVAKFQAGAWGKGDEFYVKQAKLLAEYDLLKDQNAGGSRKMKRGD